MNAQMPMTTSEQCGSQSVGLSPGSERLQVQAAIQAVLRIIAIFVVTFACYLLITHFLLQTVKVIGGSMTPTLRHSQLYLLNRFAFYLRTPQPNDVVVLRDPGDHGFSVKRVIARPGDEVLIRGGRVFINGTALYEPYLPKGTPTYPDAGSREQVFKCAPNQFFVLGDNRMNSADSRCYGPISKGDILGLLVY